MEDKALTWLDNRQRQAFDTLLGSLQCAAIQKAVAHWQMGS